MAKDFGVAHDYQAARLTDFAILIAAVGEAPNLNTRVTIEQLPWRIYPPHFGLFFETPQIELPATRPFVAWQVAGYPHGLTEVFVVDANGRHVVQMAKTLDLHSITEQVNAEKAFLAYRQIGVPGNCLVAPFDAMVPMIFQRAYGPASYADCEAWVAHNCGKA